MNFLDNLTENTQCSQISLKSQKLIDAVQASSAKKISQLEGLINDNTLQESWITFGTYLSKQLRCGKAIKIQNFGTFTFTHPIVNLNGVTNPESRDKQPRQPIFIVFKDFLKGINLQAGVYTNQGIRAQNSQIQTSNLQTITLNYIDMAEGSALSKEIIRLCVERILRQIQLQYRNGENVVMQIPSVGTLYIKNGVAAVDFFPHLTQEISSVLKKSISDRLLHSHHYLNREILQKLEYYNTTATHLQTQDSLNIEDNAKSWLSHNLNINVSKLQRSPLTQLDSTLQQSLDSYYSQRFLAVRRFKGWIKNNLPNLEILFQSNKQDDKNQNLQITNEEFCHQLEKLGYIFQSQYEKEQLIQELDKQKLGYIQLQSLDNLCWEEKLRQSLQNLKSYFLKLSINVQDLMQVLEKIQNTELQLNQEDIFKQIKGIKPKISDDILKSIVLAILCGQQQIKVSQYKIKLSDLNNEIQLEFTVVSNILKKIMQHVKKGSELDDLYEQFQAKFSEQKVVDAQNFKTFLMNQNLDLSIYDINKLTNYMVYKYSQITWKEFLNELQKSQTIDIQSSIAIQQFIDEIKTCMKEKQLSTAEFIAELGKAENTISKETVKQLKVQQFSKQFFKLISKKIKPQYLEHICELIDINKDEFIDKFDLDTFLNKYSQNKDSIQSEQDENLSTTQRFTKSSHQSHKAMSSVAGSRCKPHSQIPFADKEMDQFNIRLQTAQNYKKISNYDFFKFLDENQDGFFNLEDLKNRLKQVIEVSELEQVKFFGFMDNQNTGLIDYQRFLEVLNKPYNSHSKDIKLDSFDWELGILQKIRNWFNLQTITMDEAFKIVDSDFDGIIGKRDLSHFVQETLHITPEEITLTRIDRLHKLLDQFKRGIVLNSDFKKFLQSDQNPSIVMSCNTTKGQNGPNKPMAKSYQSDFSLEQKAQDINWKQNAEQQIGIYISKNYPDLITNYDEISTHQTRMLYNQFKKWIEDNQVLAGFNLTEKLIQQLFSDIDPHTKGYITEHDWVNKFSEYDNKKQMRQELSQIIHQNFEQSDDAFQLFVKNGNAVQFQEFYQVCQQLLPNRFSERDLHLFWNKYAANNQISKELFKKLFYSRFGGVGESEYGSRMQTQENHRYKNTTLNQISYDNVSAESQSVLDKMKKLMRINHLNLETIFKMHDQNNTGYISNIQFRNVIKQLNLGLQLRDLDTVLHVCESKEGALINWKEFIQSVQPSDLDIKLIVRAKQKLKVMRRNIYEFMLSPKDAFRQFNVSRTGYLNFDEFRCMVIQLQLLVQEEMPAYSIIKDIFDYIDIRKDGKIDINEFIESFKRIDTECEPRSATPQVKCRSQLNLKRNAWKVVDVGQQPDAQIIDEGWEYSQKFELVLTIIGRNRKILTEQFKQEQKSKGVVSYNAAKVIISSILDKAKIRLSDKNWRSLLKFAEKDDTIDFQFMFEVFKQRLIGMNAHPKKSITLI